MGPKRLATWGFLAVMLSVLLARGGTSMATRPRAGAASLPLVTLETPHRPERSGPQFSPPTDLPGGDFVRGAHGMLAPEPSTVCLLAAGALILAIGRRRGRS